MSLIFRLAGRKVSPLLLNLNRQPINALARTVTLRSVAPAAPDTLNYDDRNMKLGRPQSPHLSIYSIQLTTTLSITHRITGLALAFLTSSFAISSLFLTGTAESYIESLENFGTVGPLLLTLTKLAIALPIAYHACNGVRHLLWDMGLFLTIKQVYITGYIMVACAAILAASILLAKSEPESTKT